MFCDLYVSLNKPFAEGYKFVEFALFDFWFARRHIQFSEFSFSSTTLSNNCSMADAFFFDLCLCLNHIP